MRQAAIAVLQAIPHPAAKTALAAILTGELSALKDVSPEGFESPSAFLEHRQVLALVRKLSGLIPDQSDRLRGRAEDVFIQCEDRNRETNTRLAYIDNLMSRPFIEDENDAELYRYFLRVQKIVRSILGKLPKSLPGPVFSGGSSFLNRANKKTLPHKLGGVCAVTPRLSQILHLLEAQSAPRWTGLRALYGTEVVLGNRFATVKKDSEKDRGICVEPLANVCWQLSAGLEIRRRLRSVGVVIDGTGPFEGQNLNRYLAYVGSLEGTLATADLSNASDTVAYMLVKICLGLCPDWFDLLCTLRSPYTFFRGEWVKLEKFSSMGNGFTFELETLLFYALTKALDEDGCVVTYGDDIIYESRLSEDLKLMLTFCGFELNSKKSFHNGPFRESCGADYWQGEDVRPLFCGDAATPTEWFSFINTLSRVDEVHHWGLAPLVRRLTLEYIPKWARVYGPKGPDVSSRWIETEASALWKTRAVRIPTFLSHEGLKYCPFPRLPDDGGVSEILSLSAVYSRYHGWKKREEALCCALLGTPSEGAVYGDPIGFRTSWVAHNIG